MNLIEAIRATQNHYMSNHSARLIVEVFAADLDRRGYGDIAAEWRSGVNKYSPCTARSPHASDGE